MTITKKGDYQIPPKEGFILTQFLTVTMSNNEQNFIFESLEDIILVGEPTIIQTANSWIILNIGGGPTDDKPTVTYAHLKTRTKPAAL